LTNKVARVENFFVEHAQYVLNAREQKIILHLAANLDLSSENFNEQIVSIKDLETVLKQTDTKKWGGIYKEISEFTERIAGRKIKFPTNVLLNGQPLPGFITWFQNITPCYNDNNEVCVKFKFNTDLKPFLLKLNQYVRINMSEVAGLNSFYSLRLYQIFKSNLAKRSKYVKVVTKVYKLTELRDLFALKKKYDEFKYFNRDIITKSLNEINEKTNLFVKVKPLRTGRKVTHLEFSFCDKGDYKEYSQLSFFDADPASSNLKTPQERKERHKLFDYQKFKRSYPLIYKEKSQSVRASYRNDMKGLKGSNLEVLVENSIENACKSWFAEYA